MKNLGIQTRNSQSSLTITKQSMEKNISGTEDMIEKSMAVPLEEILNLKMNS